MTDPRPPLTAAEAAYLAVPIHPIDSPRYPEDYEGTWFIKGYEAAERARPPQAEGLEALDGAMVEAAMRGGYVAELPADLIAGRLRAALRAERARPPQAEGLREWVRHKSQCHAAHIMPRVEDEVCTCGLDAALRAEATRDEAHGPVEHEDGPPGIRCRCGADWGPLGCDATLAVIAHWCDCDHPAYGIKRHRHLPSCRYGIVEDAVDGTGLTIMRAREE